MQCCANMNKSTAKLVRTRLYVFSLGLQDTCGVANTSLRRFLFLLKIPKVSIIDESSLDSPIMIVGALKLSRPLTTSRNRSWRVDTVVSILENDMNMRRVGNDNEYEESRE